MTDASWHDEEAERRLSEAAAWRIRLTEAATHPSPDFEQWLSEDANRAAWQQLCRSWGLFDEIGGAPAMMAARHAAIDEAERTRKSLREPRTRRWAGLAAAAVMVCCAGYGGWLWWNSPDDYATAPGERRVITLADGSKLSLDADSEATVKYGAHERALHLLKGQARFDVAHDKKRPFFVVAGSQKVIATGTAFNIDMAGSKVLVTLIEGHVVVLEEGRDPANPINVSWRTELKAGQQMEAEGRQRPAVTSANIARATAWTNGQIVFDDEPLSSVAERVNRYGGPQIVIADPGVGAMKISGVLNTGDTLGFVEIVTHYLPVRALSEGPNTIALQGDPAKAGAL